MGRLASALDNAAAEAVNSILRTEYVYRNTFTTREHARQAIGRWIDSWYNAARRHGWCGGSALSTTRSSTTTKPVALTVNRPQHDGSVYTLPGD